MPKKIRELKAMLRKSGFELRRTKGSHTQWYHSQHQDLSITLSGNDGSDAKPYQERQVQEALKKAEGE